MEAPPPPPPFAMQDQAAPVPWSTDLFDCFDDSSNCKISKPGYDCVFSAWRGTCVLIDCCRAQVL